MNIFRHGLGVMSLTKKIHNVDFRQGELIKKKTNKPELFSLFATYCLENI